MLNRLLQYIPFDWKRRLIFLLCHPVMGTAISRIFRVGIPSYGSRISVDNPRISAEKKARIFFRLYERAELYFVRRYVPPHYDVVELGSGIGVIACRILRQLNKDRRLICVEADPELVPTLSKNLNSNCNGVHVKTISGAISYVPSASGNMKIIQGDYLSDARLVSPETHEPRAALVRSIALSPLLIEHAVQDYTLVSDVEGAELQMLLHDRPAFEKCRRIVIELHPGHFEGRYFSVNEMADLIRSLGFVVLERYFQHFAFEKRLPSAECEIL